MQVESQDVMMVLIESDFASGSEHVNHIADRLLALKGTISKEVEANNNLDHGQT
jgi:hypothetical protein